MDSNTSTDEIEIKEDDFNKFKNLNVTSIDENSDIQTLLSNLNFTKVSDETAKRHLDNSLKYYSVVSDTTAPTLLTSSITNGAINVSKDANIVLSFSDDIRRNLVNSTNIVLIDSNSNVIECDITSNFKTITVKPKSNLSYATSYNLTIKKELEDYGKNSLGTTDTTISFTTQSQPDTNAPTITSASSFSVNENQTSAFTITASDTSAISYSIEGTDSSLFDINSTTGVVTFKTAPDYETKASYSLIVKATDASNNSSTQNVSVVIINVDETVPDTTPPVITSASTYSVAENQTSAFQVVATDDSNTTITYSIVNQNDASAFSINPTSGVVTFNTAPDFETKTSYSLTVKATDVATNFSTKDVTVSITDVNENIITFNSLQYEIITSPITGKRWLDRNLGATQACTSSTDTLCYGDYFQWGRLADGHEKSNSTTTSTQASTISSVGNQFITGNSDWTTADADGALRTAQWSKTDGTGVCPVGFRVPTQTELANETTGYAGSDNSTTGAIKVIDSATAFSNFLKFPVAGSRSNFDGSMDGQGSWGGVWTSSVDGSYSVDMYFDSGDADWDCGNRAGGLSVRCVEN